MLKADGSTVYINAGANSNMQSGMKFLVYRAGEELIDPGTGESPARKKRSPGEIMVTQVLEKCPRPPS